MINYQMFLLHVVSWFVLYLDVHGLKNDLQQFLLLPFEVPLSQYETCFRPQAEFRLVF